MISFDDYAKTWDTQNRINRAKIIANNISESIDSKESLTAMEFGCGTGLVSFNLYNKFKSIDLVDSSKGMIEILNAKVVNYKVNNMVAHEIDLLKGDKLDAKFDVIYNSMVLHHVLNTSEIIKIFYELLHKDGYLCIVDLDEEDGRFHKKYPDFDGHNGFNQERLKNMLLSTGFDDVESNSFYHAEKIVDGEKIKYSLFLLKARKFGGTS